MEQRQETQPANVDRRSFLCKAAATAAMGSATLASTVPALRHFLEFGYRSFKRILVMQHFRLVASIRPFAD